MVSELRMMGIGSNLSSHFFIKSLQLNFHYVANVMELLKLKTFRSDYNVYFWFYGLITIISVNILICLLKYLKAIERQTHPI